MCVNSGKNKQSDNGLINENKIRAINSYFTSIHTYSQKLSFSINLSSYFSQVFDFHELKFFCRGKNKSIKLYFR